MMKKIDLATLYSGSISPKLKTDLMAFYCDYITFVRNFECVAKKYPTRILANAELNRLFPVEYKKSPWDMLETTTQDKKLYDDFIYQNKHGKETENLCFVTLEHTTPNYLGSISNFVSVPQGYQTYCAQNSLPHRIERYIIAYKKGQTLQNAKFLINGKYIITYNQPAGDMTVDKALYETPLNKQFSVMLDTLSVLDKSMYSVRDEDIMKAQNEALATSLVAPFEHVMLYSMTGLAESENTIIKKCYQQRHPNDYLNQAEKGGMIPNASVFQDYLNIRNLLHHQWDTLDGIGKFNTRTADKNLTMRQNLLESYGRVFHKNMNNRVNSYIEVAENLRPMITELIPNYFVRAKGETNTKFLNRIKIYARANPEQKVLVETAYNYNEQDKRKALVKNIAKIIPNYQVIDDSDMDIEKFIKKITEYICCQQYLEHFRKTEYNICEHCLFCGKNYHPSNAWEYFRQQKLLSPEEAERWQEYRNIRHQLSHSHLTEELIKKTMDMIPNFYEDMLNLNDVLCDKTPTMENIRDNIFRATHDDGRQVIIDFDTRKILQIKDKNGHYSQFGNYQTIKDKKYTDEFKTDVRIVSKGNELKWLQTPQGMTIDIENSRIHYPDGSKIFYDNPQYNYLIIKRHTKIITDKNFKVLNYIIEGKSCNIAKNEVLNIQGTHTLKIDNQGYISSQEVSDMNLSLKFDHSGNRPQISLNDGTQITIAPHITQVSHNGVPLTFSERKKFADSYHSRIAYMRTSNQFSRS